MNIKQKIQELDLPKNSYMVVGSGILCALGIRDSDDIDMIVTDEIFKKLKEDGWDSHDWEADEVLKSGVFDVGKTWSGKSVDELIKSAAFIDGVPYLSLVDLRAWKAEMGREKDMRDIKLIDEYLTHWS